MALEHKLRQNPRWVPTEIIVAILLKLPLESLLRCKSVCKLWHSLISEHGFIKSHLTLSPCNTHCRLISFDNHTNSFRLYDHVMMFGKSVNVVELDNPFTSGYARTRIIGSCNGLLCIVSVVVNESSTIFIWNPSTRRVNRLPSSGEFRNEDLALHIGYGEYINQYVGYGFWYDESNDDYKVVRILSGIRELGLETRVKIYSLKSGYWKTLICDLTCRHLRHPDGILLNGALHWMIGHIVSLDLTTKTFGEILPPVYDKEHDELTVCTFGEWLSVVCHVYRENRADVWVMKVYGVHDSWTKLVSIPYRTLAEYFPLRLMTLCITQDGKILLKLGKKLVLYDPKNGSFSEIQEIDTYSRAYSCVESLVSPMPATSRDTHGLFNSIKLGFKKICAPRHIWSCLSMPNVN